MNTNDTQKEAKKHRLQMEIVMKESDYKKEEHKKVEMEIEIRKLKQKQQQIVMEIATKERDMGKLHGEQLMRFAEIKKLKNELNLL